MKVVDELCLAKGVVSPSFVNLSTGRREPFAPRHNRLSYMAAEAMAAAFGGDPSYIPARIGFVYGSEADIPIKPDIYRSQSWAALKEELGGVGTGVTVDVQVVNFSYSPSLGGEKRVSVDSSSGSSDASEENYTNILSTGSNAITFHAVSNSQDRGVMQDSEVFNYGSYIYQCVLLGYHNGKYYILARASLKDVNADGVERYLQKPEGFEVALDWTVVFH